MPVCLLYAYYYNKKYQRVGHVFQDRYKSAAIEDDEKLNEEEAFEYIRKYLNEKKNKLN